jgi:predicted AlkP superfamily pyrophosphatase or phosphodiesterase
MSHHIDIKAGQGSPMKKLILAAAIAMLPATGPSAAPPKPRLILAISVDQFSSEVFNRYRPTYRGGLKTLSDAIAYPQGYQSHASTETCPGHSTILTGRHPSGTGIVSNSWLDRSTGQIVYCVAVPNQPDPNARGPQNMRVTTLGDWIKAAEPGARSFAVSGKDRAAITMGGKHADGVYWWTDGIGFTTSKYAGPTDPAVIGPANDFNAAARSAWNRKAPDLWPAVSTACAALAKPHRFGDLGMSGEVPPEMARGVTDKPWFMDAAAFHDALRASPLFDTLTADFAIDLIARERLGRGEATDVLAVSLSATDYVGHRFGNGGAEMCVQQAALDATVGRLIAAVKALKVPVMVVLTADHGATDAAEREHEHDPQAIRLDGRAFVKELNEAMKKRFDLKTNPIDGDDPQQLSITAGPSPALSDQVAAAAIAWLKQRPEVREIYTRTQVEEAVVPRGTPADRLSTLQRLNESYDKERSGDIFLLFGERTSFGMPKKIGDTVAGHGSPWNHDRQVPILFWWPGAPSETRPAPAETVDIAPTLAAVAGIVPPVPVDGQCLDLGGNCAK